MECELGNLFLEFWNCECPSVCVKEESVCVECLLMLLSVVCLIWVLESSQLVPEALGR